MIHICYGLYDKYGRYSKFTGTSILSVFENTNFEVTVHILHDNTLSEENKNNFELLAARYNQKINFYNIEKLCAAQIEEFQQKLSEIKDSVYSVGTLYRFMIMNLFDAEIKKVIYFDSDIIVNLEVNELWQIELGDKPLAGVSEQANGVPPKMLFALCREEIVKDENYFNAGVLLMNLERLRNEREKIRAGLNFVAANPQCKFFDQDIFNYCFAAEALIIPTKFNRLVNYARINGEENVEKKIYHYVGNSANFDMRDNFSRLWMEYFLKSNWFGTETIQRVYECILELNNQAQDKLIEISAAISGKRRIFFAELNNFERLKEIFKIKKSEEIIDATKPDALKILLKKMKKLRGAGFFIILVHRYEDIKNFLISSNFVEGNDFVDASIFLSHKYGIEFDTYFMIRAI